MFWEPKGIPKTSRSEEWHSNWRYIRDNSYGSIEALQLIPPRTPLGYIRDNSYGSIEAILYRPGIRTGPVTSEKSPAGESGRGSGINSIIGTHNQDVGKKSDNR